MISVVGLIISMVLIPSTPKPIFPESLPLPPLQMYYRQIQPKHNQDQEQQAQSIPYHLSSVYTFPAPNPILLFQPVIPNFPPLTEEQKISAPELQSTASPFNPSLNRSESPPQINTTTSTSTLIDQHGSEDADPDAYPIPVKIIPNSDGSTYPMQLRIPIIPINPFTPKPDTNFVPVPDQRSPILMMPIQYNIYNPIPTIVTAVTSSPIHDLKTLAGPKPEYPDIDSTTPMNIGPVPKNTIPSTEATLITSAPKIESHKLDHSFLSKYFNSIYPSVYASSYSNYVPIRKFVHNITTDGYQVQFETGNGIKSEEEGHLVKLSNDSRSSNIDSGSGDNPEGPIVHVKSGKVSWTSPECNSFTLTYVADENGYRPEITEFLDSGCSVNSVNNDISDSAPPSP